MTTASRTPLADALPGLMACVHCGFCLQSCPTYLAVGDENDSPRGRIVLMRAAIDGAIALDDPALTTHLDRCLGCRACETACPSGVPYGAALEAARATIHQEAAHREPATERLLLWLVAHVSVFAPILFLARVLRATGIPALLAKFSFPSAMLAASAPAFSTTEYEPITTGASGTVAILKGCVMGGLFDHVHRATRRTLMANDYEIVVAPKQACCGALHAHAGHDADARVMARKQIAAFESSGAQFIAVNAAGCGAMMKEYGRLLASDAEWRDRASAFSVKVRDVTELLAAAGPKAGKGVELDETLRVSYDAPCHLLHAQRVATPPVTVLDSIMGLELVPLTDFDQCCGSAGIYNLTQPELSGAVLAPKIASVLEAAPTLVATGNPGCQMQIGAGLLRAGSEIRVVHPVELLDLSYGAE